MRRALAVGLSLSVLWACDPQVVIGNPSDGGSGGGVGQGNGGGAPASGGGTAALGGGAGGGANLPGWFQQAYAKASNTESSDYFGFSVSLSGDGNTLAVGATQEDSSAAGINSSQSDNSASASGAVYVFTRSAGMWGQQAYLKASNTGAGDKFGTAVSLNGDGNILVVGATHEDSNATGVNGNQGDNSLRISGAAYVFTRAAGNWQQEAYLKASNSGEDDAFGSAVSLSADGNTIAVGACDEDSSAAGLNGNQADNSASNSGAVYIFVRSRDSWIQQVYIKASNADAGDNFGCAVSLSGDGNTLAVGAQGEDSIAAGINGAETDNSLSYAGAVYIFARTSDIWQQQAYVKASNPRAQSWFGLSVSLSVDGNTLAVGAPEENSSATGVNSNQGDTAAPFSGAVYIFARSTGVWSQQAYLKASNTGVGDYFGAQVALSADGDTLAVGAFGEDSSATGANGNWSDDSQSYAGAVYVFARNSGIWQQSAYIKASNAHTWAVFGRSTSLSADGATLSVGAFGEGSSATGIDGNQGDDSAGGSGAVYVFAVSP